MDPIDNLLCRRGVLGCEGGVSEVQASAQGLTVRTESLSESLSDGCPGLSSSKLWPPAGIDSVLLSLSLSMSRLGGVGTCSQTGALSRAIRLALLRKTESADRLPAL